MFNLSKVISSAVTFRPTSMFAPDIEANRRPSEKEVNEVKDRYSVQAAA